MSVGDGPLTIVASQQLDGLGKSESKAQIVHWHWYYHCPSAVPWALIVLLLLVRKVNRTPQAWLILVPLVVIALVWKMPLRLLGAPADFEQAVGTVVMTLAAGWAAVWLVGDWLARRVGLVRYPITLILMLAFGALAYLSRYGIAYTDDLAPLGIIFSAGVASLVVAMALSAWCCGRAVRPGAFLGWLVLWSALATAVILTPLMLVTALIDSGNIGIVMLMAIPMFIVSLVLGGLLYLINLPFMILAFKSPFYCDRLRGMFALDRMPGVLPNLPGLSPFAPPVSTEPTTAPVDVADVVGSWHFYLDELARTVMVDFKPDGTFGQTITTNRGERTECPGGTWQLHGPMIHLSGYITARQGTSEDRSWRLVDAPGGLAVYGSDDPGLESSFCMSRAPAEVPSATD